MNVWDSLEDDYSEGKKQTKHFEGYESKPYIDRTKDKDGKVIKEGVAVGHGLNLDDPFTRQLLPPEYVAAVDASRDNLKNAPAIDEKVANAVFDAKYDVAIKDAKQYIGSEEAFDNLDDQVKYNIVDMAYNLGLDSLSNFDGMREGILENDQQRIADEMKDSLWYKQTGRRGKHHVETTAPKMNNRRIQEQLLKKGYDPGAIDGKIGPNTKKQIKKFQEDNGLTPDGVVGKQTWKELISSLNPFSVKEASAAEIPEEQSVWDSLEGDEEEQGQSVWDSLEGEEPKAAFDELHDDLYTVEDPRNLLTFTEKMLTSKSSDIITKLPKIDLGVVVSEGIVKSLARGAQLLPALGHNVFQAAVDNYRGLVRRQLGKDGAVFGISDEEYAKRTPEQQERIDKNNKIVEKTDQIIENSEKRQEEWIQGTQEGWEKPDADIFRGKFMENPSFTRTLALGFQSAPILGMAAAITAVTKSPVAGAAAVGILEAAGEQRAARKAGKSLLHSDAILLTDAVVLSALETIPLTSFMKGGKLPYRMFKMASQEGGEEVLQSLWVDSVAKIGYDETRKIGEDAVESAIAGFVSGGLIGALGPSSRMQQRIDDAEAKGVDTETMREAVGQQVVDNGKELQAIAEKEAQKYKEFIEKKGTRLIEEKGTEEVKPLEKAPVVEGEKPTVDVAEAKEVPEFKSTDEAVEYGKEVAGDEQALQQLRDLRAEQEKKTAEIKAIEEPTDEDFQRGMDEAVKGQYYREALEAAEKVEPVKKDVGIPAEMEKPEERKLVEEAKKYKTAEEFISDKDIEYSGSYTEKPSGKFLYTSKDKTYTKEFGDNLTEYVISPKNQIDFRDIGTKEVSYNTLSKLFKEKGIDISGVIDEDYKSGISEPAWFWLRRYQGISNLAKDKGFDSINLIEQIEGKTKKVESTLILDPDIAKTKQQLTDIWNKAQEKEGASPKEDMPETDFDKKRRELEAKKIDTSGDEIIDEVKLENMLKNNKGEVTIPFEWEAALPTKEHIGDAFQEHVSYFENMQLPKDSKIREIKKEMQSLNGKRLSGKISTYEANKKMARLRGDMIKAAVDEGVSIVRTKKGKYKLGMREKSGVFVPEDFSTYDKYKDYELILGGLVDTARMIQEIDGALSIKNKVSTEGQAGPAERYILWRTRDMMIQKMDFAEQKGKELAKIFEDIKPDSKEDRAITKALETGSNKGLSVKLSEKADALRSFYNALLDMQNHLRVMRGQDPIPFRGKYSPEILADIVIWAEFFNKGKKAEDIQKEASLPDYVILNKPRNPHEMARKGGIDRSRLIRSSWELANRYLKTATRDIYNTSIIQNNKAFISQLDALGYSRAADALAKWNGEAFAGTRAALDKYANLPKGLTWLMRKTNAIRNLAVFPFRMAFVTGNQIKSLNNTIGRYGYIDTLNGFMQYMSPENRQQLRDIYSWRVKTAKAGKYTAQDNNNLIDSMVDDKLSVADRWNNIGSFMIEEMEKLLTGASVFAGYNVGKRRGLTGEALNQFASDAGGKTQSMYNDEDRPGILRSLIVKSVAPYQTFKFEMMNSIRELAGKTGTPPDDKREAVMIFLRFVSASILMRLLADFASKKDKREITNPVPLSQWTIDPIINEAIGRKGFATETLPSGIGMAVELTKGIVRAADTKNPLDRNLRNTLIKYAPGLFSVGGGMQAANIIDTLVAYSQGGVYTKDGKLMFRVEKEDVARGLYSGIWTTRGGEEYKEKRFIRPKILQEEWAEGAFGKVKIYPTTKKEWEKIPDSMKVGENKILLKTEKKPRKVIFVDTKEGRERADKIKKAYKKRNK